MTEFTRESLVNVGIVYDIFQFIWELQPTPRNHDQETRSSLEWF